MIEAYRDAHPRIDESAFVHENATVIGRVELGPESSIWPSAVLRGDDGEIRIGARTSIQDGSVVHMTGGLSHTIVGDRVTVGHNVTLHGCRIGDDCLIGMGSIILDNAVIGAGSVIGAGTLIPMGKEIPPGSLVFGNPYRIVRACGPKEAEIIEQGWRAYLERGREYLERRQSSR